MADNRSTTLRRIAQRISGMPTGRASILTPLVIMISLLGSLSFAFAATPPAASSRAAAQADEPTFGTVFGRVIDAKTRQPLSDAEVELRRIECYDTGCYYLGATRYTDSEGKFRFEGSSYYGMLPGTYQVLVKSIGYNSYFSDEFVLNENEDKNLGDIELALSARIGSISAHVIDARTREPLPGTYVELRRDECEPNGCFSIYASEPTDSEGYIRFDGTNPLLTPGRYMIEIYRTGYDYFASDAFLVAENENKDLGDIALTGPPRIGSINGQVIDAKTNAPISGYDEPYPYTYLYRCEAGDCYEVAQSPVDEQGRFRFEFDSNSVRFEVGTYKVWVRARTYEDYWTTEFPVAEGEHKQLGHLPMKALARIGTISGRVVDKITGEGLVGNDEPFTYVELNYCQSLNDYCSLLASTQTGPDGSFTFAQDYFGNPLLAGYYSVYVNANQYYSQYTTAVGVFNESEDRRLDDIQLDSYPVRFTAITSCATPPAKGGVCRYNVTVTNGMPTTIDGASWSLVFAYSYGTVDSFTTFQSGAPQRIKLAPGKGKKLEFQFGVPPTTGGYRLICTNAWVSKDPSTLLFNVVGNLGLFCFEGYGSGDYKLASPERTRELMRRIEGKPAIPANKPR